VGGAAHSLSIGECEAESALQKKVTAVSPSSTGKLAVRKGERTGEKGREKGSGGSGEEECEEERTATTTKTTTSTTDI
jgi:hypothetical protein